MTWLFRIAAVSFFGAVVGVLPAQPFRSNATKLCRAGEHSGCPATEHSFLLDDCKRDWLFRSLGVFSGLTPRPPSGQLKPGAALRAWIGIPDTKSCPEVELVERDANRSIGTAQDEVKSGAEKDYAHTPAAHGPQRAPGPPEAPTAPPGATSGLGTVTTETPAVDEKGDPLEISRIVRLSLPKLATCYETALREGKLLEGKIVMYWLITPAGKVGGLEVEQDTIQDSKLQTCARRIIATLTFPKPPQGSIEVSFPLVFRSARPVKPEGTP